MGLSKEEKFRFLSECQKVLSKYEWEVFTLYMIMEDGEPYYTNKEIAEKLGKNTKSISNAIQRISRKVEPIADNFL